MHRSLLPCLLLVLSACVGSSRTPAWARLANDAWSSRGDLGGTVRYDIPHDARPVAYETSFAGHADQVEGAWYASPILGWFHHAPVMLVTEAHALRDARLPVVDDVVLATERGAAGELGDRGTAQIEHFDAVTSNGLPGYETEIVARGSGVRIHVIMRMLFGDHTFYMQLALCAENPDDVFVERALAARFFASARISDVAPSGTERLGAAGGALVAQAMVARAN